AAYRIAGTGSLGLLRIAVLVGGKGGPDGAWIFDLKEQHVPSCEAFGESPTPDHAGRVAAAMAACLARPPRLVGTTKLGVTSLLRRRLAPQEDKLDLTLIAGKDLPALAKHLGALLGNAHRRGLTAIGLRRPRAWSAAERGRLVDNAIQLAGVHEATYLAY